MKLLNVSTIDWKIVSEDGSATGLDSSEMPLLMYLQQLKSLPAQVALPSCYWI